MAIELPQPRGPQVAVPKLLDWGSDQKAPMGGGYQRLNRLGNRFALDITYPRLKPEPDGRILIARLRRAKTEGALFPVPQPGLDIGNPGNPVINGGNQAGNVLVLRGFAGGYILREGQFFSVIHGGRRYLHNAAGDFVASPGGVMTITLDPMLRIVTTDGAVVEVGKPYIEGIVSGASIDIEQTVAKSKIPTITITERF
ncbi:hypothetical protein [Sphingomonas yabuuchiae]|uniref:hypothetical protein n=1 Tax=Sphingomonas yabuuchiae TaxID=172044 RepID=UPI003D961CAD